MKFTLPIGEFRTATAWANRFAAARAARPVYSGIQIEADEDGTVTFRATNGDVSGQIPVKQSDDSDDADNPVETAGTAVVPAKLLADLAPKLADAPVSVELDDGTVNITCGNSTIGMRTLPTEDYPTIDLPENGEDVTVPAATLLTLDNEVKPAVSTDNARPMLTGVQLEISDSSFVAAATDSYRLAVHRETFDGGNTADALVPADVLTEAAKAAKDVEGDIIVTLSSDKVAFRYADGRLIVSNLIDAQFPNYGKLLPDNHDIAIDIDRKQLKDVLARVAVMALGQANSAVNLTFADNDGDTTVELSANSSETGDAAEKLAVTVDGTLDDDGLAIAFNPNYLEDGLNATDVDTVRLKMRGALKPAVLVSCDEDGNERPEFTYLLMPVRNN